MACCNIDRVVSVLEEVKRLYAFWSGIEGKTWYCYESVLTQVSELECAVRFLKVFLHCSHKWSDADEVLPDLGSLSIKIQAAIAEISDHLAENLNLQVPKASKWTALLPGIRPWIETKYLRERAPEVRSLLSSSKSQLELFKPQITRVWSSLSSRSFQSSFLSYNFVHWKRFVHSVESDLKALEEKIANYPLKEQIINFQKRLTWVMGFLDGLADSLPNNDKIEDFMIHIGSVAFCAALVSCRLWARSTYLGWNFWETDESTAEDATVIFLYLEQKTGFTNPAFIDINLSLLKSFQAIADRTSTNQFVELLLTFPQTNLENRLDLGMRCTVHAELMSLITSPSNLREEYSENVRKFLADVKVVDMGFSPLQCTLPTGCTTEVILEVVIGVLNLLVKIWLIKLEIFLREQLITGDILLLSGEEQINALNQALGYLDLEERMRSVRRRIEDAPEVSNKNVKQIFTLMDKVARMVVSLNHFYHDKELSRKKSHKVLFELLLEIVLFKAESFLMELCENNETSMVLAKNRIEPLCERLKFLIMFVRNRPDGNMESEKLAFTHVLSVASGTISLCYSFHSNDITKEIINDLSLFSLNLLGEIKVIMVELKEIYLHPCSNVPKTNGLGFIDCLLKKTRELLIRKADLVASVKNHIEEISENLEFFRPLLGDILKQGIEVEEFKDLCTRIVDVAYEAEYLIDSIVGQMKAEWCNLLWLFNLLEDIRIIRMQVEKVYKKKTYNVTPPNVAETLSRMIPQGSTPRIDEGMVSLNDQEEVIIDRLARGTSQRNIVAIVGMPGIGKTTLAKKVYNAPSLIYHFHIRAWCCVSQAYTKRELLLGILSDIITLSDNILEMTDEDLEFKLYQNLKQKRYLVVMDDMWNTSSWEEMERSLPNDGNGSRILLTSRLHNVALEAQPDCEPHSLRLLSDAESWDLLQIKIFHEEVCPKELVEVGKKIVQHCKGLPLAVVAIAGLLERTERQLVWWKEIAENLSSKVVDDPQINCKDILELSYKHLPAYLKSCFLYFGAFQEDEDIPVQKLTKLWIAEGFVTRIGSKSVEDLAEDYLMDLIGQSLVMVARRRSGGGVKACRVHDMLRNLCLSKAKEDKFLRQVTVSDDASLDGLDYGDFDPYIPSNPITFEDHRLSIYSKRKHFVMSRPSGSCCRSLLFFATSDMYPRCPYDISFISENFRFLKVLNLECINMGVFFLKGIELLIHLTYLAASGDISSVPSSISNLWNLETLVLKGLKGTVVMPGSVWHMSTLRHLQVNNHAVFRLPDDTVEDFPQLCNLVSLSSPYLSYGEDTNKMIRMLPNLRNLRCSFSESQGYPGNWNFFPRLDLLTQLESLKIVYCGRAFNPVEFNFPLNLKKLTLSSFRLPWDHIAPIGRLQNLEVLKLISRAFEGQRWDMRDGEFSKLKFLKLDNLNFAQWNASSDHLPNLQQLVLRNCKHLEEVPSSFTEIPTLQRIEVLWCGQSCEESVRTIKEEEVEGLEVLINIPFSAIRSLS